MVDEYLFAMTLKGKKTNEVWDSDTKGAGAEDYQGRHELIIKQALLGPETADSEVDVVQVEAMSWKDSVKIPISTLKAGGPNYQVLLDLSFPDPPVTFTLIHRNSPIHIVGYHLIGSLTEDFEEMDEMEKEMIEDDEGEEGLEEEKDDEDPESKKAKTNNTKGKAPVKNNVKAKK